MRGESKSIIDVIPSKDLLFKGPFNKPSVLFIGVKNRSKTEFIGFKIKTTAPSFYTVKPNNAYLEPGGHLDVQVTFVYPPTKQFSIPTNHKFLIQAILTLSDQENIAELFSKTPKEQILEHRMKCRFEEKNGRKSKKRETEEKNLSSDENHDEPLSSEKNDAKFNTATDQVSDKATGETSKNNGSNNGVKILESSMESPQSMFDEPVKKEGNSLFFTFKQMLSEKGLTRERQFQLISMLIMLLIGLYIGSVLL